MFKSKKVLSLVLSVLLVFTAMGSSVFASASINEDEILANKIAALAASDIDGYSAYLTYSGTTLYPAGTGDASSSSATISITVTLQQQNGSSWTDVKSWTGSGKGTASASGSYSGTSGKTYRTKVVVKVGSSSATGYSGTKTL